MQLQAVARLLDGLAESRQAEAAAVTSKPAEAVKEKEGGKEQEVREARPAPPSTRQVGKGKAVLGGQSRTAGRSMTRFRRQGSAQ